VEENLSARNANATHPAVYHQAAEDGWSCRRCGAAIALQPGTYPAGATVTMQYPDEPGGSWRSRYPPNCAGS
jgi:hypothetical protein